MAVLEVVPGLSVVIKVDGKTAVEYDDEDKADDNAAEHKAAVTVHKFIESISDKDYGVELAVDPVFDFDFPTLSCQLFIDGKIADRPILRATANKVFNGHVRERKITGTYGAPDQSSDISTTIKKFRFAKIDVNEKNIQTIKEDTERMKNVGEIALHVFRASETRPSTCRSRNDPLSFSKKVEVHEKALKGDAKSHSTLYGPATTAKTFTFWTSDFLDGADNPIAIFKFKYRSREALKQLLIVDRTPSPEAEPSPAPNPMNIEALDDEQREQLEKFMKELTGANQPVRIKRERNQDGNNENAQKRRKSGKKVTIDLTADSDDEN